MNHNQSFGNISWQEMKEFLDEKHDLYNNPSFIEKDPVSIPHRYQKLQDREITGFLTATISWGRRDLILRGADLLIQKMGESPHEYIVNASDNDFEDYSLFVYRTFNGTDCVAFLRALRYLYRHYNCMEDIVVEGMQPDGQLVSGLMHLRSLFFNPAHPQRSEKHFADIRAGAAGKRINMFLRWMVRSDNRGVDFGIWKRISPSQLFLPLDFHSGNTARMLGLIKRKANDWKAVEEVTSLLKQFDPSDPVRYDFALFGLGINENLR